MSGIWVAGDIRGGPMFTHSAYDDFEVLKSRLLGDASQTTERLVPYAMFIDPQLGRVGLSEQQAKEAGKCFRVATYDMKKNGRARELGAREGFIKVIVDTDSSKILGAAVLAAEGAELVHVYISADERWGTLHRSGRGHSHSSHTIRSHQKRRQKPFLNRCPDVFGRIFSGSAGR